MIIEYMSIGENYAVLDFIWFTGIYLHVCCKALWNVFENEIDFPVCISCLELERIIVVNQTQKFMPTKAKYAKV